MKIAQIQMSPLTDKTKSLAVVKNTIQEKVPEDTDLIALPEMFCCPYQVKEFPLYAEEEGGPSSRFISELAKSRGCYISAGSMPEISQGKVYNTAYVFDRQGKQIAKHRKIHLFDIEIKKGQHFRESETLSPGDSMTTFDTEFGRFGLAVCYDIRFPELFRLMALDGARVILVPASFNMTTGPAHWELVFRSQAMFSQAFIIGTSTSQADGASYRSYGHSLTVDPWGKVLKEMDDKPGVLLCDIDIDSADQVRSQLPLLTGRRTDVYSLQLLGR